MELTRKAPIEFNIRIYPGSTVTCAFRAKGLTKDVIKINVSAVIYHKSPTLVNATKVTTTTENVFTSGVHSDYAVSILVPDFTGYVRSFVSIRIDNAESYRDRVDMTDIRLADHKLPVIDIKGDIQIMSQKSIANVLAHNPGNNNVIADKIVLLSTWNIKCGIATYTNHLLDRLNSVHKSNLFTVFPVNNGAIQGTIDAKLLHLQHEYGIIHTPPISNSKMIITWHTIPANINNTIRLYEAKVKNIVAHIVHSEPSKSYFRTSKDVYVVSHGSVIIPEMKKEDAKKTLNIKINKPIGFVFGFQSGDKNYGELINAAKDTGIHIIISGATHGTRTKSQCISNNEHVTFLNTYLTEDQVNLYASASDILLFDYAQHSQYSVSGAMHRIVGSGRPVICSDIRHFSDIDIALKFRDLDSLECAIVKALEDKESLGKLSLEYAKKTSWENVAQRHIEIYKKYVDI